jgi:hypothetical protein
MYPIDKLLRVAAIKILPTGIDLYIFENSDAMIDVLRSKDVPNAEKLVKDILLALFEWRKEAPDLVKSYIDFLFWKEENERICIEFSNSVLTQGSQLPVLTKHFFCPERKPDLFCVFVENVLKQLHEFLVECAKPPSCT